jgi:hypothetical protein
MSEKPELLARVLAIHMGRANAREVLATGARFGWQFISA